MARQGRADSCTADNPQAAAVRQGLGTLRTCQRKPHTKYMPQHNRNRDHHHYHKRGFLHLGKVDPFVDGQVDGRHLTVRPEDFLGITEIHIG